MSVELTSEIDFLDPQWELERLYESAPIGLAVLDRDLRYLRVNETLAAMNGRTVEEHIGRAIDDVIPGFVSTVASACRRVLATGEPCLNLRITGPMRVGDNPQRIRRASYSPLRDETGFIRAISAIVVDLTDQADVQNSLQQQIALNQERLEFERFLSEISSQFISLPAREIDREIVKVLARVVEYLNLDRSCVMQFSADKSCFLLTHFYSRPEVASLPPMMPHDEIPWYTQQIRDGRTLVFSRLPDDLPPDAIGERATAERDGMKSHATIALQMDGEVFGALGFTCHQEFRQWTPEQVESLHLVADIFTNALARKRADEAMAAAMADIQQLKDRLQAENVYLREEVQLQHNFDEIVGQSKGIRQMLKQVEEVAGTDSTVLLVGETGTGKELLARAIHARSARHGLAMVNLNCAALPATLMESELFGREKGAYTGALTRQLGRFELADRSTLFLDEVSEMPLEMQVKLLRVLQDGKFERLGSGKTIQINVRVIAATNRDLAKAVQEGRFREDLFYRLNVFPISIPPLRERREDIPQLVWAFVKEFSEKMGKNITSISRATMAQLQQHDWAGNIRELRNVVERAMILSHGSAFHVELATKPAAESEAMTLDEAQRRHILAVLKQTNGRIRGALGAAEILDINPTTLESRMAKLGIARD